MKTLKSITMALALFAVCFTANAANKTKNLTKDEAINTYVTAVTTGKTDGLENAIADNAQFNLKRGDNVITSDKTQMLAYLKSTPAPSGDCKCTNTIIKDEGDGTEIIKVDMQFSDILRTNVITVERKFGTWAITNVDTSFK